MGSGGGPSGETAKDTNYAVKRLLAYLRPYWLQLSAVSLLVVVTTIGRLAGPILLGLAIDRFILPGDVPGLIRISILMLVVYVIAGVAAMGQGVIMVVVAQRLVRDIRSELFAHVQTLSMAYHDHHRVGDLMSRLSNDTEAINRVLTNGLIEFTTNILLLGGIMVSMFLLNWQLALGVMLVLPLMLYITVVVTRYSRKAFREVQAKLGALNAVMEENIAGVRVVKAFAREEDTIKQVTDINAENRQVGIKADIITAALGPMFTTMMTITIAVVALLGGWLSLQSIVSVGVIATFVVYVMNFFRPMRGIAMLYNGLQSALAGAERIFEVLDDEPSVANQPNARPLPKIAGEVTFDNVSFAYEEGKPVLEDVTLTARRPDHRSGRPDRRRQDDHHQLAESILRRNRGRDPDRWSRHP
jgi:ATP-binding cassette subfamily B multidrug efflux pump